MIDDNYNLMQFIKTKASGQTRKCIIGQYQKPMNENMANPNESLVNVRP